MSGSDQELEVKFLLKDMKAFEARLVAAGGVMTQPRQHELNLRFDTPKRGLSRSFQTLRLRRDSQIRLTYKGPGGEEGGARLRREVEFTVSDFEKARTLFELLGYQVFVTYEKHRTTYRLGRVEVTLDEMPFGSFTEIEGPDGATIQAAALQLGLDWERRCLDSYLRIFERVKERKGLEFRDLSFANFKGLAVSSEALGLLPADGV
jgi:adenylate cyclase, class 2